MEGEDIIIKAIPLDSDSDPDIYISKVKFPDSNASRKRDSLRTVEKLSGNVLLTERIHAQFIIQISREEMSSIWV